MAFEKLQFTKSWTSAQDFPTYEPSEAQVRADLQLLHDEARDGLNKLVDALNDPTAAAQVPFQGQGLTADNVQDAVLEVYAATRNAAAGQIVNGSVTKEKLAAALLQRTYGGRPWVSMDTPGTGQNPDTDFPIGQVWLRPSFTVENLAESGWSASGGTVEAVDNGWKLTGNGSVVTAGVSQSLTALGTAGQRVYVSLRASDLDGQLTGLTLTLNGTSHDISQGGGVFETALDSAGGLTVTAAAQWPAAALAVGSVTLTHFAVVNSDAVEARLTDCQALSDWPALLTALVPFSAVTLPKEVYIQVTPGSWHPISFETLPVTRGGTGLSTVSAGQLLYAGGTNALAALPTPETDGSFLRFLGGEPAWNTGAQVIAALGSLRIQTGTYTGNAESRTITLPVTPKLLLVFPQSGPSGTYYDAYQDNPIVLGNGAKAGEVYSGTTSSNGTGSYGAFVSLSGSTLSFSLKEGNVAAPTAKYGNRSGVTYSWVAVY